MILIYKKLYQPEKYINRYHHNLIWFPYETDFHLGKKMCHTGLWFIQKQK